MSNEYEIYSVKAEMFNGSNIYPNLLGFVLHWTSNIGFGDLNFYYDTENEEWDYDSECMGKEFCKAVLDKWLDNLMNT